LPVKLEANNTLNFNPFFITYSNSCIDFEFMINATEATRFEIKEGFGVKYDPTLNLN
jgi:hypothetical protein